MRTVQEIQHLLDVASIVPSIRGRLKLICLWLVLLLKQTGKLGPRPAAQFTWQGPAGPLSATVSDLSELKVIREVFLGEEYAAPEGQEPEVIVDLGSNAGFSVLFFKSVYPNARIIAVEPHPDTFQRLRLNTAYLENVHLVNAAVTDHDGEATLYSGNHSWAAALSASPDRPTATVIPTMTLQRITEELDLPKIDLLKMDIEGSEHAVLASSQEVLRHTRSVIFEYHQEHHRDTLWMLLERLADFRLVRFKGDSRQHPVVTLTRSSPPQ
jgi:FkbM family methyltransferase